MEITNRRDLGGAVRAPQFGGNGQVVGHDDIVRLIRPGDIVLHWYTEAPGGSAIVGWSVAVGPLAIEQHPWSAHAGSMAGVDAGLQPNWVMPLGGIHLLDAPITTPMLLTKRDEILAVRTALKRDHRGSIHFPFVPYGSGLRSFQGYMTKVPTDLIDVIGRVGHLELESLAVAGGVELDEAIIPATQPDRQVGYQSDARRRQAIELHAVERAIDLYLSVGAHDITVLGKPYDLLVRIGDMERHIEVKGSSGTAEGILVTRNEVRHARTYRPTDLVVVDRIEVDAAEDGSITTAGGRLRRWTDWAPTDEQLHATAFECALPTGNSSIDKFDPS